MTLTASFERAGDCCRQPTVPPAFLLARPLPQPTAPAPARRQRSRLWELNESVHCSIIGTCLTTAELRRIMGKILPGGTASSTDHDLHAQAVSLCNHHSPAAKLLQKALDQRHATTLHRFARLTTEAGVLDAWATHRRAGDIPGAYWAVLTHPELGHAGLRRVFGDVHMLSHLVGAANRADITRLTALEEENAALHAKVGRQQSRLQDAIASRDDTIRQLGALAASGIAGQLQATPGTDQEDALAGLRHLVATLQSRLEAEAARRQRLDQRLADAEAATRASDRIAATATASLAAAERELAAFDRYAAPGPAQPPTLPAARILYVGGHPGVTDRIRLHLAQAQGTLLLHDGGRHDHPSLLPGLIGQADLVAFPVDCVSHDAALAVKRLCRQQAKPWTPLRSAGLGAFLAMMAEIPHPTETRP